MYREHMILLLMIHLKLLMWAVPLIEYNFFVNGGDFIANDGRVRVGLDALTLTASPFTKTSPAISVSDGPIQQVGLLDHYKQVFLLNSEFDAPECGQLFIEATLASKMTNVDKHPFGEAVLTADADLRLAFSTVSAFSLEHGLHLAMAHTNDTMYALYEILPIDKDEETAENSRASFAAAIRVARRDSQRPLEDFQTVGIAYDKRKGALWYVNGNLVHQEPLVGHRAFEKHIIYDLGGQAKTIDVRTLTGNEHDVAAASVGLVRLSNFPYGIPFTPGVGQVTFVDEGGSINSRLYGQGAITKITNFKVEYRC